MARFFKFHSLEEIEAECKSLGLDIHFTTDISPLFRPVKVGSFTAGNSFCVQPMEGCDATPDGTPDELTYRRFRRFGAGGAKLIWGEAAAVVEEGRANPRQLLIREANLSHFGRLVSDCRRAHLESIGEDGDLVIGLQLTHSGRYSYRGPIIAAHDPLLDPRTVADKATGIKVDGSYPLLSDDELRRISDHYIVAAKLAFRAGFQFVDLKQCHRYLLNELLSAKTRPGDYGGSLENRTRFVRELIERIRAEVPGLVIASRLNLYDGVPFQAGATSSHGEPCAFSVPVRTAWGTNELDPSQPDLTEPAWWIGEMQRLGVSLLNLSLGNPYASPHFLRPFEVPPPDGYKPPEHPLVSVARHFQLAGEIQQQFPRLPMVGSGYSYLQEFLPNAGAANVRDGRITIVGVGRASLAQPDFVRQLQEHGRLERKRICRTFSYCTALMRSKQNELGQFATGCPPFDKEVYGPIWDDAKKTPENY